MYWNGQNWVDQYGAPAGTSNIQPQGRTNMPLPGGQQRQSNPTPQVPGADMGGGNQNGSTGNPYQYNYLVPPQPTQQAPVWAMDQYGTPLWDTNGGTSWGMSLNQLWDNPEHIWEKIRMGQAQMLRDYFMHGGYDNALQMDRNKQQFYSGLTQDLDNTRVAQNLLANTLGLGSQVASDASTSAMAMGLDPRAAGLEARNANVTNALKASDAAFDPNRRDQLLASLIGLSDSVAQPSYLPMLQWLGQSDLAWNGQNITDLANNGNDGGFLGGLGGLIGTFAGMGGVKGISNLFRR